MVYKETINYNNYILYLRYCDCYLISSKGNFYKIDCTEYNKHMSNKCQLLYLNGWHDKNESWYVDDLYDFIEQSEFFKREVFKKDTEIFKLFISKESMEMLKQRLKNALETLVKNRVFKCKIDNDDFQESFEFYEELRKEKYVRRTKENGWYVYKVTTKAEETLKKLKD